MHKILGTLIVIAVAATPAIAQQVTIDYAHDFDFSKVKTFAYQDTKESNVKDPLMDGRIKDAIIQKLTAAGLNQVDSDPGMYVTYHVTTKEDAVYDTTGFGYGGLGAGWGGWGGGMAASTTTVTTQTEGTLIIDGYDSTDKKMIWRGTGMVMVKAKPEKQTQQIQAVIDKLGMKWQKIHSNAGK